jgi:hypothetical protein
MAEDEAEAKEHEAELAKEVAENKKQHDEALAAQAAAYKKAEAQAKEAAKAAEKARKDLAARNIAKHKEKM